MEKTLMPDSDSASIFMELAISMAKLCKPKDEASTPKVGAVVSGEGVFLTAAHRGEDDHAEKLALDGLPKDLDLSQTTVYTTLKPCTKDVRRKNLESCTDRLIERRVKRVVIGMLDPNQDVVGRGVSQLQLAG